jgi:hypothetical protein
MPQRSIPTTYRLSETHLGRTKNDPLAFKIDARMNSRQMVGVTTGTEILAYENDEHDCW